MQRELLIVGNGYTGTAIGALAARVGWRVRRTTRRPIALPHGSDVELVPFDDSAAFSSTTHLLVTAPPSPQGDPVWAAHSRALRAARLDWVGYISTTGVYGDRAGGWVDEGSAPHPGQARSRQRLEAERQWESLAPGVAVDLLRTGGIYGPGRSALDDVRSGAARRVMKPGHSFSRIHVHDIARAVLAAAGRPRPPGGRILHLVDDLPAEQADVTAEAARLLGVAAPPAIPFAQALTEMSEMGRSFWAENRRISCVRTKAALGIDWVYPSYREGLAGILAEERAQGSAQ